MNNKWKILACLVLSIGLLTACGTPEDKAQEHLQKGKEFFEKGEFDKAILELKTSSQEGKLAETYYYMALLDEKRNNLKTMRQNLLRTLELQADFTQARLKLGKIDFLFGNLENALEQAETVLKAKPDNIESKLLKVEVYFKQEKYAEAESIVDDILKTNPDNIDALFLKARQHFQRKENQQALVLLDTALQKDEKNIPARLSRIRFNADRNDSEAMAKDYQELIRLYPDTDNFGLSLASLYSMRNKLQEAEAVLRDMINKSPNKVEHKTLLLEFLDAKAKERVAGEFEQLISNKQPVKQVLELSKWMLANGYTDSAMKGLSQVVDAEKKSSLGLATQILLGEIALSKKQYDVVETTVDSILKANSDFVEASLLKARLLLSQNKLDEAVELLNKAVWSKNDSGDAYFLLGEAYRLKNDRKQADKNFKQALEVNPGNLGAFFPVYQGYIQANQMDIARQHLEKALKAKPNNELLLVSKAELDIQEKKWEDAQTTVQRLAMISKNPAVTFYLQANILQGKEQYADAIGIYQKLLEDFPDHSDSMVNLIRCFESLKSRDKAIAYLVAHHDKHPESLVVVGMLGDLYAANQDLAKAKQLYSDQLKQMPKAVTLYLDLAKVEVLLSKNTEVAKDIYLKGLQNNTYDSQLMLALAGWYEETDNKINARKVYESLLEKHPENDTAINNLAALLIESSKNEDINKGLILAEKFKNSENVYFLDTYAWAQVKAGQSKEGLKLLESIVLKEPKSPDLRYHLGVAHFNNGNKITAVADLKQALSLSETQQRNFSGKTEAKKLLQEIENL